MVSWSFVGTRLAVSALMVCPNPLRRNTEENRGSVFCGIDNSQSTIVDGQLERSKPNSTIVFVRISMFRRIVLMATCSLVSCPI